MAEEIVAALRLLDPSRQRLRSSMSLWQSLRTGPIGQFWGDDGGMGLVDQGGWGCLFEHMNGVCSLMGG